MTPTLKTIVFFGTDEFSAVSLRELIEHGFTVVAVVTKPDSRKGRGREVQPSLVKQIALENNIPVWQPLKMDEIADSIKSLGETPIGVLVSYGKIIPQSIIDLFEPGIINVHPSLLPKYRGPSPVESAILYGDTETGVSIMQLSAAMDAGPVYKQVFFSLDDTETAPELEAKLAALGAQELTTILPSIMNGSLQPQAQNDASASYCKLLRKEDGVLTPETVTAEQAERQIRAFRAYPKTKATIAGHSVVITKAHITTAGSSVLDVQCNDGQFLSIDELIGPSGRVMDTKAFLNGYAAG
ncbi:MAG: fmt [Candidatus Saccharibacteria bacterium]|nr:fmt [Candidatus Saccharibacteria bacterium]